jgi:hypothetical protein
MTADGERGWVCSETPGHFELASERPRSEAAANRAPHARSDHGGVPAVQTTSSQPEPGEPPALRSLVGA